MGRVDHTLVGDQQQADLDRIEHVSIDRGLHARRVFYRVFLQFFQIPITGMVELKEIGQSYLYFFLLII